MPTTPTTTTTPPSLRYSIKVPLLFPAPYDTWDPGWVQWAQAMDGKVFTTTPSKIIMFATPRMGSTGAGYAFNQTLSLTGIGTYAAGIDYWIPAAWVSANVAAPAAPAISVTPKPAIPKAVFHCNSCGGFEKHRLMCPAEKKP